MQTETYFCQELVPCSMLGQNWSVCQCVQKNIMICWYITSRLSCQNTVSLSLSLCLSLSLPIWEVITHYIEYAKTQAASSQHSCKWFEKRLQPGQFFSCTNLNMLTQCYEKPSARSLSYTHCSWIPDTQNRLWNRGNDY
jgi:hypothetical protein